MKIPNELREKYAKRLFRLTHPNREWLDYPNMAQAKEQYEFRNVAAEIIEGIAGDLAKAKADKGRKGQH